MVEQGHPYWFREFGGPPELGLAAAEELDRSRSRGLWKQAPGIRPWDYRRVQRRTVPQRSRQSGWLWVLAVLGLVIPSVFLWDMASVIIENISDVLSRFSGWVGQVGWPGQP